VTETWTNAPPTVVTYVPSTWRVILDDRAIAVCSTKEDTDMIVAALSMYLTTR